MFSLIITLISIALVAALALATLYYGGSAFTQGSAKADASKILLQGQQLLGAAELFKADTSVWPTTMAELVSAKYLTSIPVASATTQKPAALGTALAATAQWTLHPAPTGNSAPVFVLNPYASAQSCAMVNAQGTLKAGAIFKQAFNDLAIQCYGESGTSSAYTVVIKKTGSDALTGAIPASEVSALPMPTDLADSAWELAPVVAFTRPAGVPTPPVASGTLDLIYQGSIVSSYELNNVGIRLQGDHDLGGLLFDDAELNPFHTVFNFTGTLKNGTGAVLTLNTMNVNSKSTPENPNALGSGGISSTTCGATLAPTEECTINAFFIAHQGQIDARIAGGGTFPLNASSLVFVNATTPTGGSGRTQANFVFTVRPKSGG